MGKASRLKRDRQELRVAARQTMTDRMSSKFGEARMRAPQAGETRISDSLRTLLDPYFDEDTTSEAFRRTALIGMVAWNRAVMPEDSGQEMLREARQIVPVQDQQTFVDLVENLAARKRQLFPDDLRLIVDVQAHKEPDGVFYITAASGIQDPK